MRPARHFQHAAQWAETNTTVAPGLIVRSTTATVSQWSEYSTTSVQQTTEVSARTTGSSQFQTIRTQTIASSSSSNPSVGPLTPGQYLDDLKVKFRFCCFGRFAILFLVFLVIFGERERENYAEMEAQECVANGPSVATGIGRRSVTVRASERTVVHTHKRNGANITKHYTKKILQIAPLCVVYRL